MTHEGHHITTCPECDGELDIIDTVDEKPLQPLTQHCTRSGCSFQVEQCVLWYPNDTYVVVAPAVDDDVCGVRDCTDGAVARYQEVSDEVTQYRCLDCLHLHLRMAWQETEVTTA